MPYTCTPAFPHLSLTKTTVIYEKNVGKDIQKLKMNFCSRLMGSSSQRRNEGNKSQGKTTELL